MVHLQEQADEDLPDPHCLWMCGSCLSIHYSTTDKTDMRRSLTQLMELVGYGFRAGSSKNPFKVINFILQYFMIVCVSSKTFDRGQLSELP